MQIRFMTPMVLSMALSLSAALAQAQTGTTSATQSTTNQSTQSLPQQIRQKLTDQGFSDVRVVPGSFLVSAKDKQGDPVTMIIGPNSMTVFTISSGDDASNVGSGSGNKDSQQK